MRCTLGKLPEMPPHLREHLADILCLRHAAGALVVELVVGVNDQAADAVAQDRCPCKVEHPVDARELVVLVPDEEDPVLEPRHALLHLGPLHPLCGACVWEVEEGLAHALLQQLPGVILCLRIPPGGRKGGGGGAEG